jgi:hypothetical protein
MKNLIVNNKMLLLVVALLNNVMVFAQDGAAKVDVNVTKTTSSETWYANPILWVVGIGVFILLLVALLRGGRRTDA